MTGSKYNEKDAAKDTKESMSWVKATWHGARDDAEASGDLQRGSESGSGGQGGSSSGTSNNSDSGKGGEGKKSNLLNNPW
jgi:hypothetical protein